MTSPPRHPDFEALIRQARAQTAPPVKIGVEDVRRAAARRSSWRVAVVAVAAGIVAAVAWAAFEPAPTEESPLMSVDPPPTRAAMNVVPEANPQALDPVVGQTSPVRVDLENGATLESLDASDPRSGYVGVGTYVVRTTDDGIALPIGGRVLQIEAASEVFIDNTLEQTSFEIRAGGARWSPSPKKSKPTAAELATKAERAMIAGRRGDAVRALRTLVRQHPSSDSAKGALVDLARLEKALGRTARARCAYALFLQRFPTDARAPSVRSASERLGVGATKCRGLTPDTK